MIKLIILLTTVLILIFGNICSAQDIYKSKPVSPERAKNYSMFLTLGSIGLSMSGFVIDPEGGGGALVFSIGYFGLIFTPGTGHLYAHHSWRFWRGALIRIGGSAMMLTSLALTWDDPDSKGGLAVFLAGGAVFLGSTIYDVATAKKSAHEYNQSLLTSRITLKPYYFAKHKAPGLMISVSF